MTLPSARPMALYQAPSTSHLLAAYSFDASNGIDASGHGNTLLSQGAGVTYAAGYGGMAAFGAGNVASACLAADATTLQPEAMTLMGWVNVDATQTGNWVCAFGLHCNHADWPIWGIYPVGAGDGIMTFGTYLGGAGGQNLDYTPPGSIRGAWHHFAGTYDGTTKYLYFDGELVATQIIPATFNYATVGAFHVLGDPNYGTGRMLAGGVDDVRIYDIALSAAQVQTCMNSSVAIRPDPII